MYLSAWQLSTETLDTCEDGGKQALLRDQGEPALLAGSMQVMPVEFRRHKVALDQSPCDLCDDKLCARLDLA